jgi:hypothetical protein
MKMVLRNIIVAFSSTAAILLAGSTVSMAATPVFETTYAKAGDGRSRAPGSQTITADGMNIYQAYTEVWRNDDPHRVYVARSADGGKTWSGGKVIADANDYVSQVASIKVSGDASNPSAKIIHLVWESWDEEGTVSIKYAWMDAAEFNYWSVSVPTVVNGQVAASDSWARTSINATQNGEIHVLFQGLDGRMYHTAAEGHSSSLSQTTSFSTPDVVPGNTAEWGDIEATLDSSGNLHVAYPSADESGTQFGVEYTKRAAGTSTWTEPVVVASLGTYMDFSSSPFTAITAYNQDNIYIAASDDYVIDVYVTSDGGASWLKSTPFPANSTVVPSSHVTIGVNSNNKVYVGTNFWNETTNEDYSMIFMSANGGRTWGSGAVIPSFASPSITFDAQGKVIVGSYGSGELEGGIYCIRQQ